MLEFLRRRWQPLCLLALLALAGGLRFYRLDAQSLWNDEGTSVALAQRSLALITRGAAADIHPPLYYYLLHVWIRLWGTSALAVRSLSAILGIAVVWGTCRLGRGLFSPATGFLAGLLAALSAFQVYYSQEARMYILVTCMGLLSMLAYLRLLATWEEGRTPGQPGERQRTCACVLYPGLYWITTVLAVYSHYFAFSLLLAQNIGLLFWWGGRWRAGARGWRALGRPLAVWAALQALIGLAYLPWLLFSWSSLQSWPAVSATLTPWGLLSQASAVFSFGVSVERSTGVRWIGLALMGLALPGLLEWGNKPTSDLTRSSRFKMSLAVLYLLAPLLTLYVLSLRRPMYKDKFLLLATPALQMLQAQSIVWFGSQIMKVGRGKWLRGVGVGILMLIVCTPSLYALRGLYDDPRYWRDDYRGIVAYINATAGPQDAILISAPAQIETVNYYYHGPLPEYPLPTSRPLDSASTQRALEEIVARHPRVYAIFWATQEADPEGLIEGWLERRCFKALDSWFGNLRLVVYAAPQVANPEIAHPLDYTLGQEVRLRGYTLLTPAPRSGEILQLALYWQALQPISRRYKVFVHLLDGRGQIVSQRDSEAGGGARPTDAWQVGDVLADNYGVLIPPGTPPGVYRVRLGLYDGASGQRLAVSQKGQVSGDALDLTQVTIGRAAAPPPLAALDMQRSDAAQWGALNLLGHALYRSGFEWERQLHVQPGDTLKLLLFWRKAGQALPPQELTLELQDGRSRSVVTQPLRVGGSAYTADGGNYALAGGSFPFADWREGEIVRDVQLLSLPANLSPGAYRLTLRAPGDKRTYTLDKITIKP